MNTFEVKRLDDDEISILHLKGFLDAHTAPVFEEDLQKLFDQKRFKVIVNLSELNYISSAGLGVFMGFIEDVRNNEGDIRLCSMMKIFYTTLRAFC